MYDIELEAVVKLLSSRLGITSLHFKLIKVVETIILSDFEFLS
jgi:hypothetical protein